MVFILTALCFRETYSQVPESHEEARVKSPRAHPPSQTSRVPGACGTPFSGAGRSSLVDTTMWALAEELEGPNKKSNLAAMGAKVLCLLENLQMQ